MASEQQAGRGLPTFEITGPQLEVLGRAEQRLPAPAKRPWAARVIAVALALAAVFGLGGAKLAAYHSSVEAQYTQGVRGDGMGIASDLQARGNAAANIITLGEALLGENDPLVLNARAALDALQAESMPSAQYAANLQLGVAVDALYQQLTAVAAGQGKGETLSTPWSEFLSRQSIIEHDGYNEAARRYNDTVSGFPAGLIGALWGVQEVELFQ